MSKIKVAVVGVGNLISGLIQGTVFYSSEVKEKTLLHPMIGSYRVSDIEVVAAFDIDYRKVGKELSEAIFCEPNKMPKLIEVSKTGIIVEMAPILDGIAETAEQVLLPSNKEAADIEGIIKSSGAELLIIGTPTGAIETCEFFAEKALNCGIGVINVTPTPLAREEEWVRKFDEKGLILLGDDLQSQAGGTVFHKGVLNVLNSIGVRVQDTYQLDVSGGLEGLTTLDYDRRQYKRSVKEESIKQSVDGGEMNVASGTTDYLDFLGSLRIGHYWVYGSSFLDQPIKIDIRTESIDGSNGAATLVDIIRSGKLMIDKKMKGVVPEICSYLFKAPTKIIKHEVAKENFEKFIL